MTQRNGMRADSSRSQGLACVPDGIGARCFTPAD